MQGLEHLAFHMQGPGRHKFGSNWFWYFHSLMGAHVENDANMDTHDGDWTLREVPMSKEAVQLFLFENVAKWAPGGPPPDKG